MAVAIFWRVLLALIYLVTYMVVLTMLPISLSMLILQTSGFWVSIFGYFVNRERILPTEGLAMVVCFFAVVAISFAAENPEISTPQKGSMTIGLLLAVVASILVAV